MSESANKLRAVRVRLPQQISEPLDRATERLTVSQSDFVRLALVEKLERMAREEVTAH